ncbi:hypothetical protein BJP44_04585 [Candidatus Williamhamiltonella defendens]|nr:hypothetical protein BJP44_04585 [Candidatus Hamiltonella defensa]
MAKGSTNTKKVWVKKRMRISGMVPPKEENPRITDVMDLIQVQKCTWVLRRTILRKRHQKKENERFLKV